MRSISVLEMERVHIFPAAGEHVHGGGNSLQLPKTVNVQEHFVLVQRVEY